MLTYLLEYLHAYFPTHKMAVENKPNKIDTGLPSPVDNCLDAALNQPKAFFLKQSCV